MLAIPKPTTHAPSDSKIRETLMGKIEAAITNLKNEVNKLEAQINECQVEADALYDKAVTLTLQSRFTEGSFIYSQYTSSYRRKIGYMETQTKWNEVINTVDLALTESRLDSLFIAVNSHMASPEKIAEFGAAFMRKISEMEKMINRRIESAPHMESIPYSEFKEFVFSDKTNQVDTKVSDEDDATFLADLNSRLSQLKSGNKKVNK